MHRCALPWLLLSLLVLSSCAASADFQKWLDLRGDSLTFTEAVQRWGIPNAVTETSTEKVAEWRWQYEGKRTQKRRIRARSSDGTTVRGTVEEKVPYVREEVLVLGFDKSSEEMLWWRHEPGPWGVSTASETAQ